MISPDLIIFAIRTGLRLGEAGRRAYIDRTAERPLILPLPNVALSVTVSTARDWFNRDGRQYLDPERFPRLARLHEVVDDLDEQQRVNYLQLYEELYDVEQARRRGDAVGKVSLDPADYVRLMQVREFAADNTQRPSTLQRIVGALVDAGVDYFSSVPGAIPSEERRHGRVIIGIVRAMESIPFHELSVDERTISRIASRLLKAGLDTLAEQPEIVASDHNVQRLVEQAAEGLSRDLSKAWEASDGRFARQQMLVDWAELVFSSMLSAAGRRVVEEPAKYLGIDKVTHGRLIKVVGTTMIELASGDGRLSLDRLVSRQGLEKLVEGTLLVVSEHPQLAGPAGQEALGAVIRSLARTLANKGVIEQDDQARAYFRRDLLPDVARLVLQKTNRNFELIWPDLESRPERHLLAIAAKRILTALSAEPPQGSRWTLRFTGPQALALVDAALNEMANNPQWLIEAAKREDRYLAAAVEATLKILRKKADSRLGPETALHILASAVRAVAMRLSFVEKSPNGEPMVAAVVEAVIATIFREHEAIDAAWQLVRDEAVRGLIDLALKRFATSRMRSNDLAVLTETIEKHVRDLLDGSPLDMKRLDWAMQNALEEEST